MIVSADEVGAKTRGLTLGKFAPLHRGHQLLIETALAEVDELLVVIYDSPEVTDIPLAVRAGWIRSLYPTVRVIEAWGGPSAVGYTPELMRAHEDYVIRQLNVGRIDRFYSSEPYGEHMSIALGAVDCRVDPARSCVSVSATMVRQDPFACRDFLHPMVYRDHVANVVLLGAPGTGKTTLAQRLAREFDTQWMPEYGREYWERHQRDRRLTLEQLVEIAEGHRLREDALLLQARRFLFTDTNALTTATFARYYHGSVPARLQQLADEGGRRYDLVLLCETDIPYPDTWDRSGEVSRAAFQRQVVDDLRARKLPFFVLRGAIDERLETARQLLRSFRKFSNVLALDEGGGV